VGEGSGVAKIGLLRTEYWLRFMVKVLVPVRITMRYDTRCYFNVRSKADMSQLNLPHRNDN